MSKLRILQIANQAGPLRLFMLPLCERLRELGAEVELACMETGPNYAPLSQAGFKLHGLTAGTWSCPVTWVRCYRQIRSLLKASRFDLMIAHTPAMSWIARYAARNIVPAVIYMAHGLPFAPRQSRLSHAILKCVEQWAGQFTDGLIVMNHADAQACAQTRLTRTGGQWFRVPGVGVDCVQWAKPVDATERDKTLQTLGIAPGKPMVAYMGRFIKTKRPLDVVEVARRIGPSAEFVLAGEGPLWGEARRQAQAAGPHVHVLEFMNDIGPLLKCCSVVAFPSVYREGLPRLLLEAQAAGKPVVAYDVRGNSDAVENGVTGLLVEPGNVDAFYKAVEQLLSNPKLSQEMGAAGQRRVQNLFSLNQAVQAAVDAVEAVLHTKNLRLPASMDNLK